MFNALYSSMHAMNLGKKSTDKSQAKVHLMDSCFIDCLESSLMFNKGETAETTKRSKDVIKMDTSSSIDR